MLRVFAHASLTLGFGTSQENFTKLSAVDVTPVYSKSETPFTMQMGAPVCTVFLFFRHIQPDTDFGICLHYPKSKK